MRRSRFHERTNHCSHKHFVSWILPKAFDPFRPTASKTLTQLNGGSETYPWFLYSRLLSQKVQCSVPPVLSPSAINFLRHLSLDDDRLHALLCHVFDSRSCNGAFLHSNTWVVRLSWENWGRSHYVFPEISKFL
jgi:hypothetical protein